MDDTGLQNQGVIISFQKFNILLFSSFIKVIVLLASDLGSLSNYAILL